MNREEKEKERVERQINVVEEMRKNITRVLGKWEDNRCYRNNENNQRERKKNFQKE